MKKLILFFIFFLAAGAEIAHCTDSYQPVIHMNHPQYQSHSKRIVLFPHQEHSLDFIIDCSRCHHDEDAEPIKDLAVGGEVENCIECHSIPAYTTGKTLEEQLEYHSNTLHIFCKGCHRGVNRQNHIRPWSEQAAPTRCYQCHLKDPIS